jgi:hypothetical protein
MNVAEKSDKTPAPSTKKVPQVVQSFAYGDLWLTPTSPTSEVQRVPASVLKEHADTGFVRFVDAPND